MTYSSEEIESLLNMYTPLLHKTMQRLNIRTNHMDYDDFFQEFQIKLLTLLKEFDGTPLLLDSDRFRFTSYAQKGLYWHGLNLIRKKTSPTTSLEEYTQNDSTLQELNGYTHESDTTLFVQEFMKEAVKRLSKHEVVLLHYLVENTYSISELCQRMNVSRDTIYQRKNKIKEKLEGLKECLIN